MKKGIFLTGTDTDIGKTYICALMIKKLMEEGYNPCYYKAAVSGSSVDDVMVSSDAKYICDITGLKEDPRDIVSFSYVNLLSPHLAAKVENNPFDMEKVKRDYAKLCDRHDIIVAEGSGGVACPISVDGEIIMLSDVILTLGLDVILIARAGLGTINHTMLSVGYLRGKKINISGIILNEYDKTNKLHADNWETIEKLTGIKVICGIKAGQKDLDISVSDLLK